MYYKILQIKIIGYYHLGVVKALLDANVLPTVISGTSAGSLIGSFVCCRTDQELFQELNPQVHKHFKANDESPFVVIKRLLTHGVMFDPARVRNWDPFSFFFLTDTLDAVGVQSHGAHHVWQHHIPRGL